MAFKPSDRRNSSYAAADLDIRPIMNLMVCIIPLLLKGAEFVKMAQLEVTLPPSKGAASSAADDPKDEKQKEQVPLSLTVSVTSQGFYISATNVTLFDAKKPDQPTIPLRGTGLNADGKPDYDYPGLRAKLKELKAEVEKQRSRFSDLDKIIITMAKDVPYEVYVRTQDTISGEKTDKGIIDLFPVVMIGKVI